jgi:hypothetical protein
LGLGIVQAFRRAKSTEQTVRLKFCGLNAKALYQVRPLGGAETLERRGRDLMESGLAVSVKDQPGVSVLVYRLTAK